MFNTTTYITRRAELKANFKSGIILFLGNNEAPMNYGDNTYHFRQDSTYLYYFGLDQAGLAAVIDIDNDKEIVFGNELTVNEIVWMGALETIAAKASRAGISDVQSLNNLGVYLKKAISQNRHIHFVPQYRADNMIWLEDLLGIKHTHVNDYSSVQLIRAVSNQRSVKTNEEIQQMELALDIAYEMFTSAMKMIKPGIIERDIAGSIEGIALRRGSGVSFPSIVSVHGEILHNHNYNNTLQLGDILVIDAGAESVLHYASDITRTFPVSGKFTEVQKDIYQLVLNANLKGIETIKAGIMYKDVHLCVAKLIAEGLKNLGFLKGNTDDIVDSGAHALFFPHGLGHLVGLDVHDLENYGEAFTGYDENIIRSQQFGMRSLRFAKQLQAGMVITVEPGIYFIPQLIKNWQSENKLSEFINYDRIHEYIDFRGIRIEDDVLVTESGSKVLGKPIPKSIDEIESVMG